jgi:hypothetical protein
MMLKFVTESIHDRDQRQTFKMTNFIIIGAGTAGCVIAKELIFNIPHINIWYWKLVHQIHKLMI